MVSMDETLIESKKQRRREAKNDTTNTKSENIRGKIDHKKHLCMSGRHNNSCRVEECRNVVRFAFSFPTLHTKCAAQWLTIRRPPAGPFACDFPSSVKNGQEKQIKGERLWINKGALFGFPHFTEACSKFDFVGTFKKMKIAFENEKQTFQAEARQREWEEVNTPWKFPFFHSKQC